MKLQTAGEKIIIPRHVAIIMDGNGRWAKARGLPRAMGHKRGADTVRSTVENALEMGIRYLTLFGFSSENWKRSPGEVFDLMSLLRLYLSEEVKELNERGIRFRVIGDREKLEPDIVALIERSEHLTSMNKLLTLTVALSYGGRRAIVMAARDIAQRACKGLIKTEEINENLFEATLETSEIPDPDLVIRTSGEKRISNFLLWESAYSEFVFTDTLWPDFSKDDLVGAIEEYANRERRFGAA